MNIASKKIKDQRSLHLEKIATDFEDLFLGKREGHMTEYIYEGANNHFDKVVKENKSYYIVKSDIENISKYSGDIYSILGDGVSFVEFGPGCEYTVGNKTVPLLKKFKNIISYNSIDIQMKFAESAISCVRSMLPKIKSFTAYQANFTLPFSFPSYEEPVCLLSWGSTFSNFSDSQINQVFHNINGSLKVGDFIVLSIDCCSDLDLIKEAYSSQESSKLMLFNAFKFLKTTFNLSRFDDSKFEFCYEWNKEENAVNLCLQANAEQRFPFYGKITHIPKGKKYHLVRSRKFSKNWVETILGNNGFKCIKTFSDNKNNPVNIYVAQKI